MILADAIEVLGYLPGPTHKTRNLPNQFLKILGTPVYDHHGLMSDAINQVELNLIYGHLGPLNPPVAARGVRYRRDHHPCRL